MSLSSAGANATISTFAGMVIFFSPPLWEGLPLPVSGGGIMKSSKMTPTNYMHRLCHRPLTVHSHKTARGTHLALALFAHSLPYLPVAAWLGATGDHRPGPEKGWVQLDMFFHATPIGLDAHLRQTRGTEGKRRSLPTETPGRISCATHSSFSAWRLGLRLLVLRVRAPFRSTRQS